MQLAIFAVGRDSRTPLYKMKGTAMNEQAGDPVNRKLSESGEAKPTGAVSGEYVAGTFEYDGGRQVTMYVPPNPPGNCLRR